MSRSHNYNIWRLRRVDGQQAGGGAPLDRQFRHPNRGVNGLASQQRPLLPSKHWELFENKHACFAVPMGKVDSECFITNEVN